MSGLVTTSIAIPCSSALKGGAVVTHMESDAVKPILIFYFSGYSYFWIGLVGIGQLANENRVIN